MAVPQTLDWSPLSFPVEVDLVPVGQFKQRTGIAMKPESLTWHETANYNTGADADMHSRWLDNGAGDQYLSVHFFVDDHKAIQKIPLNEVSWHAGDGDGPGNYTSLSFEFCVNFDGDFEKTFRNMAELFGYIQYKLDLDDAFQHNHWSGKDCPRLLRQQNRWLEALDLIEAYKRGFVGPIYVQAVGLPWQIGVDLGWQNLNGLAVYSCLANGVARRRTVKRSFASPDAPVSGPAYETGATITLASGEFKTPDGIGWYLDAEGNRLRSNSVATSFYVTAKAG
jgi:hypothetical protein